MTEKKLELMVKESAGLNHSPGDFGEVANEKDGTLYLPSKIYNTFQENLGGRTNLKSSYDLVSLIVGFPGCFKMMHQNLGWTKDEFKKAQEKIMNTLRPYAPEEYFNWNPPKRAYGVLPKEKKD